MGRQKREALRTGLHGFGPLYPPERPGFRGAAALPTRKVLAERLRGALTSHSRRAAGRDDDNGQVDTAWRVLISRTSR